MGSHSGGGARRGEILCVSFQLAWPVPCSIEMAHLGQEKQANREFDAIAAKELSAAEFNNLCWDKALANVPLDRALKDCDRSLEMFDDAAAPDIKAMVLLRQSRFDEAIAQFDLALKNGTMGAGLCTQGRPGAVRC